MKRVIVQEGKQATVADTPSGEVTPTEETDKRHLGDPETAEEKYERSPSDLEKGLDGGDGVDDVEDEKGKN